MSKELQLRSYQEECLDRAKETNTIVHLPTGLGKTLIAARLVNRFLAKEPKKVVGFLVPTRALADTTESMSSSVFPRFTQNTV